VTSVSSVVNPSSAGHGLHPSEIGRPPAPAHSSSSRRSALLSSVFCRLASGPSAGHGLHPPFFDARPALR
jgi:hypothetical protein